MTKLFLAAGVAALAIAAPAAARSGGPGGKDAKEQRAERSAARADRAKPARVERSAARANRAKATRVERSAARPNRARAARVERSALRSDRIKAARVERSKPARIERQAARVDRGQRIDNRAARVEMRANRDDRVELRAANRADRGALRTQRVEARNFPDGVPGRGLINGCPPGLAKRNNGCLPPGQAAKQVPVSPVVTAQTAAMLRAARVDDLNRRYGLSLAAPTSAVSLLGMPLNQANAILPLAPVPSRIAYLYPSTANYDYRYNDGYIYRVDKTSSLISALIPLLAGGLLPGQMLPASYMNSYVPSSYGYNSFYQDSPYECTRYANGVIYTVDCATGLIENVTPMYNSGYGVGQLLPSSYGYYNVPDQYRSYYYNTPNTGYWYAPGAIYQYDPKTSLITAVAALLAPGLTVGQQLPVGYGAYNVPLAFRDTYYDTNDSWYRYANGNIYQVDPMTQLVTAIVASALT